jgi:CHASE1-domain containing sensor protein
MGKVQSRSYQLLLSCLIFLSICLLVILTVKPFSILNIIGPAAGSASALAITWGSITFISIALSFIAFYFFIFLFLGETPELGIMVIIYLSIILQAFWAKQLTYKMIDKQKWLNSRVLLISLLARIGLLASLLSATSGMLVAVLVKHSFDFSLIYVFITCWSGSLLATVFITPSLLLTQGRQQLKLAKRIFIIVASVLGGLAIVLIFHISHKQSQHQRQDNFTQEKRHVIAEIKSEISLVSSQINALNAFFKASDFVSSDEFEKFSSHVFQQSKSIRALEWIPVISKKERQEFELFASNNLSMHYQIFTQQTVDGLLDNSLSTIYLPVFYIYPRIGNEAAFGLDLYTHPIKKMAIETAAKTEKATATAPLTLIQDDFSNPGLLVFSPLYNANNLNSFGQIQLGSSQRVSGFILSVVQFEYFFSQLSTASLKKNIRLFVEDVSNKEAFIIFGDLLESKGEYVADEVINVFGRQWHVKIKENNAWIVEGKSWQIWAMLIGGTIGGFLFQLLILMMAAYSTELSAQVEYKTRELIDAKNNADKDNYNKTQLLQSLSDELSTPIQMIQSSISTFNNSSSNVNKKNTLDNIQYSTERLVQLVGRVADLSTIDNKQDFFDEKVLDLHLFLSEIPLSLTLEKKSRDNKVKLLFDTNLPHLIVSDPLRLKQMLTALLASITELFYEGAIQMSVKAHVRHRDALLFFTFCYVQNDKKIAKDHKALLWINRDVAGISTYMALAKEIALRFDGDIKLSKLQSGSPVLTCSVKIKLADGNTVLHNELSTPKGVLGKKRIILFEEKATSTATLSQLLIKLNYLVEIVSDSDEISTLLQQSHFDLMIIDNVINEHALIELVKALNGSKTLQKLPIASLYQKNKYNQLSESIKQCFAFQLSYPLQESTLQKALNELLQSKEKKFYDNNLNH